MMITHNVEELLISNRVPDKKYFKIVTYKRKKCNNNIKLASAIKYINNCNKSVIYAPSKQYSLPDI